MASLAAEVQTEEQDKPSSAPSSAQTSSVSIQTQTEDAESQTHSLTNAPSGAHGHDHHATDPAGSSQGSGAPQPATQEFEVHPPAPPQEGGTAQQPAEAQELVLVHTSEAGSVQQQPGEAQELVQVHTSVRMPPSSSIPTGSVLKPVQATLLIPAGAGTRSEQPSGEIIQSAAGTAQTAGSTVQDGAAKPRAPPRKPLTVSQKLAVINLHKGKERVGTAELAHRFGVPERTIKQVCTPQNEERVLKALKRPEKLSQEDRAALRRRMISKACIGKARLTVAQKLQIIKLHETSPGKTGVSAAQVSCHACLQGSL